MKRHTFRTYTWQDLPQGVVQKPRRARYWSTEAMVWSFFAGVFLTLCAWVILYGLVCVP